MANTVRQVKRQNRASASSSSSNCTFKNLCKQPSCVFITTAGGVYICYLLFFPFFFFLHIRSIEKV